MNAIKNFLWLAIDKGITSLATLFITIYTAKYLGPSDFGVINICLSFVSIFVPIAQLGNQNIIFDQTVKSRKRGRLIIKYTSNIRFLVYVFISFVGALIYYFAAEESNLFIYILMSVSGLFLALDSYKPFYDATSSSKVNALSSQFGVLASQVFRIILIYISAPVLYFTIPYVLNSLVPFIIRKKIYDKSDDEIENIKLKDKLISHSVSAGIPLALSAVSIVLYIKINQIFLSIFLSAKEVGIYAASISIGQGWVFIPVSLIIAFLPKIMNKKDVDINFSILMICSILISIVITSLLILFKNEAVIKLLGNEYNEAINYLPLICFAGVFTVINTLINRIIIYNGFYKFILIKTIITGVISIIVSLFLVKNYGLLGAAISTLIIEVISAILISSFFKNGYIIKLIFGLFIFNSKRIKHI